MVLLGSFVRQYSDFKDDIMSSHLFNIGDRQRLDREDGLADQLPRQMMRTADDSIMNTEREADEFNQGGDMDFIFDGMIAALKRRMA